VIDQKFEVNEFTADVWQSTASVTGTVVNRGLLTANNVAVTVDFYDGQGARLGTFSNRKDHLGPGQSWHFRVEMKGADVWKVARFQLNITAG
jgi:hypothetical protein